MTLLVLPCGPSVVVLQLESKALMYERILELFINGHWMRVL